MLYDFGYIHNDNTMVIFVYLFLLFPLIEILNLNKQRWRCTIYIELHKKYLHSPFIIIKTHFWWSSWTPSWISQNAQWCQAGTR